MTIPIKDTTKSANMPLSLEQIAWGLKQLPPDDLEELDLMLDKDFKATILERGKTAWTEHKAGNTLTLDELKKELDV